MVNVKKSYVETVREAGIVGLGGAGFPTHVKIDAQVDTVIANGAECEPLLCVDKQLMELFSKEIVEGLEIVIKTTGAKEGIIALKEKYTNAIDVLKKEIKNKNHIKLFLLDNFYPAGDEQVLVYEVLKRIVPEGGIPLNVNVVVNNVGTLFNISQAQRGKVLTHRYVTITGAVQNPITTAFPIGTSIADAIACAGGASIEDYSILLGGPMMGVVVKDESTPITKTTSGIIVLPKDHLIIKTKTATPNSKTKLTRAACIRCSLCTDICPRNLLGHSISPHKVMRSLAVGNTNATEDITNAFLCCECGLCTFYACVMSLDPCSMNAALKKELSEANICNPHKKKDLEAHVFRNIRKMPVKRLISRINLTKYNVNAPLKKNKKEISKVTIPLKQHIGTPSLPIVKVGDYVNEGDLVAKIPPDSLGANIHASISGIVQDVSTYIIIESTKGVE